jgi:hypothetical protein
VAIATLTAIAIDPVRSILCFFSCPFGGDDSCTLLMRGCKKHTQVEAMTSQIKLKICVQNPDWVLLVETTVTGSKPENYRFGW